MRKPAERNNTNWIAIGAIALGLITVTQIGDFAGPGAAHAGAEPPNVPFNASAQRKAMLDQLKVMNQRLATLESRLESGIKVKVTEMPAVKVEGADKD